MQELKKKKTKKLSQRYLNGGLIFITTLHTIFFFIAKSNSEEK